MKEVQVTARIGKEGPPHTVTFNEAETVQELIDTYGEEVTLGLALSDLTVRLQGFMRSKVNAKEPVTGDDLQAAVDEWKPGTRQSGPGRVERLKERISKMSAEEKAALLEELSGSAPASAPAKPTLVKTAPATAPAAKPQTAQAGKRR